MIYHWVQLTDATLHLNDQVNDLVTRADCTIIHVYIRNYPTQYVHIYTVRTNPKIDFILGGISIATNPLDTRVQVNRTAFLFCQASYDSLNYDLTYMWKFNGHLIEMKIDQHFIQVDMIYNHTSL